MRYFYILEQLGGFPEQVEHWSPRLSITQFSDSSDWVFITFIIRFQIDSNFLNSKYLNTPGFFPRNAQVDVLGNGFGITFRIIWFRVLLSLFYWSPYLPIFRFKCSWREVTPRNSTILHIEISSDTAIFLYFGATGRISRPCGTLVPEVIHNPVFRFVWLRFYTFYYIRSKFTVFVWILNV